MEKFSESRFHDDMRWIVDMLDSEMDGSTTPPFLRDQLFSRGSMITSPSEVETPVRDNQQGSSTSSSSSSLEPPPSSSSSGYGSAVSTSTLEGTGGGGGSGSSLLDLGPTFNLRVHNWPQPLRNPDEEIPIWTLGGFNRCKRTTGFIPPGLPYVIRQEMAPLTVGEEAAIYVVPDPKCRTNEGASPSILIDAKATHQSGFSEQLDLQKLDNVQGYRCSFLPVFSGKYSVKITQKDGDVPTFLGPNLIAASIPSGLVCPPTEIEVSRNYRAEARDSRATPITLVDNGEKYWGIAVDKMSDRFYVTDRQSNEVIILDPITSTTLLRFGQQVSLPPQQKMFRPTGVVVDQMNRRVITIDKDKHRVVMSTLDGQFISAFGHRGHRSGEFNYPWGVDVSPDGNLIAVVDSKNHRIQIFDRFGHYLNRFTVFESNPFDYKKYFDYPRAITFSHDGKLLYITDFNVNNIIRLDLATMGYRHLLPQGMLNRPQGITMDENQNLLVCDSRKNCLRVITDKGEVIATLPKIGGNFVNVPVDCGICSGNQTVLLQLNGCVHVF